MFSFFHLDTAAFSRYLGYLPQLLFSEVGWLWALRTQGSFSKVP
jgi:hypothetical protein